MSPLARPKHSTIRYVFLATLTVIVTLTAPERTTRTHSNNHETWKTLVLYFLALLALYILHGSDPGYLGTAPTTTTPCIPDMEAAEAENGADEQALLGHSAIGEFSNRPDETTTRLTHAGSCPDDLSSQPRITTRRTYCQVCHVSPPLRSHHCKECRRCVATFDHHCAFIDVCIGERNHARFLVFVTLQFAALWQCCRVLSASPYGLWSLLKYSSKTADTFDLFLSLYMTLAKGCIYTLTVPAFLVQSIHLFMALTNSTTFEFAKASHLEYLRGMDVMSLPFSQGGMCVNVRLFVQRDDWFRTIICRPCARLGGGRIAANNSQDTTWTPIEWPAPSPAPRMPKTGGIILGETSTGAAVNVPVLIIDLPVMV